MNGRVTTRMDHVFGLSLCVVYVAILLATAGDLGMARDEGFYVSAAQSYAQWFRVLIDDPSHALTTAVIDRHWGVNHEHPALIKSLFAWSHLAQERWHLFATDSLAFRFPGMLTAGLLLWLIYIFGAQVAGRRVGGFGALAYALLPRPFYHSHLDCFDVPITLMITLVTYMYWRALTDRRFLLPLGLTYGLALSTKHNAWATPIVFAIHFACVAFVEHRRRKQPQQQRLSLFPWWFLSMALIGPLVLIGTWPWMWHDTWSRLGAYAAFHLKHDYYNMAYFGVNYFRPPFPMSYSWVMTAFTVPLTTLLLSIAGLWRVSSRFFEPAIPSALLTDRGPQWNDTTLVSVLWLGSLFAPLALITLPSTPIFGGTKHWFPAYPFLALFAGVGFALICEVIDAHLRLRRAHPLLCGLSALLLLAPAAAETAHSHPFGLSHYTYLAGGVPGAADYGMNRQFWGFTTGSLTEYLIKKLPDGGSVYICDTAYESFQMLARDHKLPANIRPTADITHADIALVHHEHHFAEVDFQIWTAYGSVKPDYILAYDGVPIMSAYLNPRK
jgi:4-amino-4-deoxy-L-arabinose transferase-like glycosyltransferase